MQLCFIRLAEQSPTSRCMAVHDAAVRRTALTGNPRQAFQMLLEAEAGQQPCTFQTQVILLESLIAAEDFSSAGALLSKVTFSRPLQDQVRNFRMRNRIDFQARMSWYDVLSVQICSSISVLVYLEDCMKFMWHHSLKESLQSAVACELQQRQYMQWRRQLGFGQKQTELR